MDVNFASPHRTQDELVSGGRPTPVARGWIALGERAYGVLFAIGNVAVGGIAIGAVSVGVISAGGLAVGGLAFGGLTCGVIGIGGLGTGMFAFGGLALGWMAFGGGALAWRAAKGGVALAHDFAVGGYANAMHANDLAAKNFIEQGWLFKLGDTIAGMKEPPSGAIALILAVVVLIVIIFPLIAYRRRDGLDGNR